MNRNGAEQGYSHSRLWLNNYLKTINHWNIENYDERFHIIQDRFLKIWKYPDVDIPVSENTVEENIFNAESPTNKKLEYFIFEDNKIEESAIAFMYSYVIKSLFERNPELLIDNQDILKITKKEEDFRYPGEVLNGYFIEYNNDSRSKFYTLKNLLELFNLEDELIIKYADNDEVKKPSRFSIRREFGNSYYLKLKILNYSLMLIQQRITG